MKRTTIFVQEDLEGDLKGLSRRRGLPVAELVREALHEYVAREKTKPVKRPRFAGVGASGRSDVAEKHDEHLWQDLEPHGRAVAASVKPVKAARRSRTSRPAR